MVAGRPNQGEPVVNRFFHHRPGNGFGTTRADKVGFGHHLPDIRIGEMDPLHVLDIHDFGFVLMNAVNIEKPLFHHLILGI